MRLVSFYRTDQHIKHWSRDWQHDIAFLLYCRIGNADVVRLIVGRQAVVTSFPALPS